MRRTQRTQKIVISVLLFALLLGAMTGTVSALFG